MLVLLSRGQNDPRKDGRLFEDDRGACCTEDAKETDILVSGATTKDVDNVKDDLTS